MAALKVFVDPLDIEPSGGVARVADAQRRYLPQFDIEIVGSVVEAQVYIGHAGSWTTRSDIPRVAHCHGLYWSDYRWPRWAQDANTVIARAFVEADAILCPAEWVAQIIRRDMWAPVQVMPNGVDPELLSGPQAGLRSSSYVYYNKPREDEVCRIAPFLELAALNPDTGFVATTGQLPRGAPPNILAKGVVPYERSLELMRNAGVYLATTREVFGVSVLEAMATGTPVLGFDWGGQREQLLPYPGGALRRQGGYLVPPDDIETLNRALHALQDPTIWARASEQARERVADAYLWPALIERQAEYLHKLHHDWTSRRTTDSPKISIVIPSYNLGKWLPEAVESCLRQVDAPPFEIIIIDDASPDDSWEIACAYRRNGVKAICHESNSYLAETLNTGIRAARGEWIVNLDADNMLPPHALRDLWRAAERNPGLDVVYGKMHVIDTEGVTQTQYGKGGIPEWPPASFDYAAQLAHENQVHSSAMFRRRVWERSGGYRQRHLGVGTDPDNPLIRLNSDAEFWTRAAALGFRFGRAVDAPTLTYRMRQGQMSATVPEWDWHLTVPHTPTLGAPGSHLFTHEPIEISVYVRGGDEEQTTRTLESLWPQSFDRWEAFTDFPSYVEFVKGPFDLETFQSRAKGKLLLVVTAGTMFLPTALEELYYAYHARKKDRVPGCAARPLMIFDGSNYLRNVDGHGYVLMDAAGLGRIAPEAACMIGVGSNLTEPAYWRETSNSEENMACPTCGGGMTRMAFRPPPSNRFQPRAANRMGGGGGSGAALTGAEKGEGQIIAYVGAPAVKQVVSRVLRYPDTGEYHRYVFSKFQGDAKRFVRVWDPDLPRVLALANYFRPATEAEIASLAGEGVSAVPILSHDTNLEVEMDLGGATIAEPPPRPEPAPARDAGGYQPSEPVLPAMGSEPGTFVRSQPSSFLDEAPPPQASGSASPGRPSGISAARRRSGR